MTPGNDYFTFESMTLNLGDGVFNVSSGQIVRNGGQPDNVFVAVPAGHALGDLVAAGSSAQISPASPAPNNFNLSHLCPGTVPTTTTPTTTTPTTTTPTTTTPTTTTPTTTTTSTTTTTTPTTTTSPTSTTTSTTTTTTSTPTTTTTTTPTTTTTTTAPCRWDPQLPAGSDQCVPEVAISAVCFEVNVDGDTVSYWFEVTNEEVVAIDVTWSAGTTTLLPGAAATISSATNSISVSVDGKTAATAAADGAEMCQNDVEFTKVTDGPATPGAEYTIQVSRLVGAEYVQEGDTFTLVSGETITIPLPSTFNEAGINYRIAETDAGGRATRQLLLTPLYSTATRAKRSRSRSQTPLRLSVSISRFPRRRSGPAAS